MSKRPALLIRALVVLVCLGMLLPAVAFAQDATPATGSAGTGETIKSPTCEQVKADWKAAFAETDETPTNLDGTYVVGSVADLQGLNPYLAESDPSLTVVAYIYESLFAGDPRTGEPSPCGLTDWWEIAPDGVTYTFHLNTRAKWQDGVDFTAKDVIFSMDALADPATASLYTGAFTSTVKSWTAIDDDTVQLVAYEPRFTVLYDLGGLFILPEHIWGSVPHDQWGTDPGATGEDPSRVVGTGPFVFKSWTQGQEFTLERNENYYDEKPAFKTYEFRVYPDADAQFNAFLDGDLDSVGLQSSQYDTVKNKAADGLNVTTYPDRGFTYYEFNMNPDTTDLFLDARVRQAFMWALDRQSIVDNILLGFGSVADSTQPPISYAYDPDGITTKYSYDPEKAKQLLADAGWTDSDGDGVVDLNGEAMSFDMLYQAGSPELDTLMAYFQEAWKAVGIDMHPQTMDFNALLDATTTNPVYRMALYSFGWDASFVQEPMFACNQYQVGFNDMKYCNPDLDAIFTKIKQTFDVEDRVELMTEAANIVNDDQPIGVINFDVGIAAWNSRVHNYHPTAWGNQSYIGIWVDS